VSKSVQEVIRDNTGVGVDLRNQRSVPTSGDPISRPDVFLKPAGVDAPPERNGDAEGNTSQTKSNKRERADSTVVTVSTDRKKRKKNRKTVE
jgi:hypothetical protein